MAAHLQSLITYFSAHPHFALAVIFIASLLESLAVIGTVIPGSTVVFMGGVLVGLGALNPWVVGFLSIGGAILGDGVSYGLGRRYHGEIQTWWPMKSHPKLFDKGREYFARRGGKSIFLGRFLGPVRAIVPVIAGMSNMPAPQFYLMNIASAFAWAAAHILPGVLFGASLQLAGAVSSRLLTLIVIVVVLAWSIHKLVRFIFVSMRPRLHFLRNHALKYAQTNSGWFPRLFLSLVDAGRPEYEALFLGAMVLVSSTWLFLGILQDVFARDPLVQFDQAVRIAFQNLHVSWLDTFMILLSGLSGSEGIFSVIAVASLFLVFKRYWHTLGYWLGAALFAELLVQVLNNSLHSLPLKNFSANPGSFLSGHIALSIVVYGFLALLLARGRSVRSKIVITLLMTILVTLIAFARLYLGGHRFSEALASLSLGLAWVALMGIAYTYHVRNETLRPWPILLVIILTATLATAWSLPQQQRVASTRSIYHPSLQTLTFTDWQGGAWRALPLARSELDGDPQEPFELQWAGRSDTISKILQDLGWTKPRPWGAKSAMAWLLPKMAMQDFPVLAKLNEGEAAGMTFTKIVNSTTRIVIRLWKERELVDVNASTPGQPLWVGMVTTEKLRRVSGFLTLATTDTNFIESLNALRGELQTSGLRIVPQTGFGNTILLVSNPPGS